MRTDHEIVDQTNELARRLYSLRGFQVPDKFRFDQTDNPRAKEAWEAACEAQLFLTDTDPHEACYNLEEDDDER